MIYYPKRVVGLWGLCALVFLCSQITANADPTLVNQGPVTQSGTGFGAVVNILSLQLQGGPGPLEAGSVTPGSTTGDATNTSQCATVLQLTNAGINSSNLAFVFNINQTGGDPTVHLDDFTANFYSSTGTLLFSASTAPASETDYTLVAQGTGGAGYLFTLTAVDQSALDAFFSDPDNCIGAIASVSGGVDDGPENFYATRTNAVEPVPEPATLTLLGLGLMGAGAALRKHRRGE